MWMATAPPPFVYLARRLGVPFTWNGDPDSEGKGLNFAVSGASTGEGAGRPVAGGGTLAFGMKNQLEIFVRDRLTCIFVCCCHDREPRRAGPGALRCAVVAQRACRFRSGRKLPRHWPEPHNAQ